jgi:DNA-binding XRE family transcriptional regulator
LNVGIIVPYLRYDDNPVVQISRKGASMAVATEGSVLAKRLQRLRDARKLSQEELARRSGLSVSTIRQIEQGRAPDPRISTVAALARGLGVTFDALLAEDQTEE